MKNHQLSTFAFEIYQNAGAVLDPVAQAVNILRRLNEVFKKSGCSSLIFFGQNRCVGVLQCPYKFSEFISDQIYEMPDYRITQYYSLQNQQRYISRQLPIGILRYNEIIFDQEGSMECIVEDLLRAAKHKYPSMVLSQSIQQETQKLRAIR